MAVTLYRQVGKGKDRRYQKVNLGRGRRPADLTGPYAILGDRTKAKSAYESFLTLWQDADPDIPILKQAKTEYTKLQ